MNLEEFNRQVKELYLNKEYTTKQTAAKLNVSETTIIRRIRKLGIGRGKIKHRNRKDINNNYFSEINTPKKAYLLGFIYADGNNNTKKKGLNFKLQSDDYYIVEELAKEICGGVKYVHSGFFTTPKGYKSYWTKFNVTSRQISEDLENKFGLVARKSKVIRFPFHIEEKYYSHFIRGYFDGDGTVGVQTSKKVGNERITTSAVSNSKEFLEELQKVLKDNDIKSSLYPKNKGWNLEIRSNENVYKFRDYIYNNSKIHLIRKRIKFYKPLYKHYTKFSEEGKKKLSNNLKKRLLKYNPNKKEIIVFKNNVKIGTFSSIKEFAESINGASYASLRRCFNKYGTWKGYTYQEV